MCKTLASECVSRPHTRADQPPLRRPGTEGVHSTIAAVVSHSSLRALKHRACAHCALLASLQVRGG